MNRNALAGMPWVRPVGGMEDFKRLLEAAREDGHGDQVLWPSHVIEKDGRVAGFVGLNSVPVLRMWMHTKLMTGRDCLMAMNVAENLLRAQGERVVAMMVHRGSPMFPTAKRLGWTVLGDTVLHYKQLVEVKE